MRYVRNDNKEDLYLLYENHICVVYLYTKVSVTGNHLEFKGNSLSVSLPPSYLL